MKTILLILLPFTLLGQQKDKNYYISLYIHTIANSIEFPASRGGNEFVIGVIGDDIMRKSLYEYFRFNLVKGKRVDVKDVDNIDKLRQCHILYVPEFKIKVYKEYLPQIDGAQLIIITNRPGFEESSMNLFIRDKSIKLQYNLLFSNPRRVLISPDLLKLGEDVNSNSFSLK